MSYLFLFLLFFTAIFLILLILIQRGKGGGLAGAFGGMGGQSAFGTKAGDTFTRITIGVAAFWIVLCVLSVLMLGERASRLNLGGPAPLTPNSTAPASSDGKAPAAKPAAPAAKPAVPAQPAAPAATGEKTAAPETPKKE